MASGRFRALTALLALLSLSNLVSAEFDEVVAFDVTTEEAAGFGFFVTDLYATGNVGIGDKLLSVGNAAITATHGWYQDPNGNSNGGAPNNILVELPGFEQLKYDTYVTFNRPTEQDNTTAIDPDFDLTAFAGNQVVGGWFWVPGNGQGNAVDIGGGQLGVLIARLTLNVGTDPGGTVAGYSGMLRLFTSIASGGSPDGVVVALSSEACGDGFVFGSEECDDGGESVSCDADCTFAACGDGTINTTAGEECDDGNSTPGDGCSEDCQICVENLDACCRRIYVNGAAVGADDGTSWTDAFVDLQSALDVAVLEVPANSPCARIWVAAGTYKPTRQVSGLRSETFLLQNKVAIYGGFAGGETSRVQRVPINLNNPTLLSGDLGVPHPDDTDNALHVVTAIAVDRTAVLDGFFIILGRATGAGEVDGMGGGMFIVDASPTVTNSVFFGNAALSVGGAALIAGIGTTPSPAFTNCVFMFNWAVLGSGVFNFNGSPAVTNSVFWQNWVAFGGGAMWSSGTNSRPQFTNCSVVANLSTEVGAVSGGIYIDSGSVVVANSILWFNASHIGTIEGQQVSGALAADVSFSNIQGLAGLTGNSNIGGDLVNHNPGFADASGGDVRLFAGSPSIDSGSNAALPIDEADLDQDGNLTEPLPLDLDLIPRINGTVDMGAYESGP